MKDYIPRFSSPYHQVEYKNKSPNLKAYSCVVNTP